MYKYQQGSILGQIEELAMLKLAGVGYYDGETVRTVVDGGLQMANGINQSPDGRWVS